MVNEGWLNVPEVASYIGESEETVYDMIDCGQIQAARFEGRKKLKVRRSTLEAAFDENIVKPKTCETRPRLRSVPEPGSFAARNQTQDRR